MDFGIPFSCSLISNATREKKAEITRQRIAEDPEYAASTRAAITRAIQAPRNGNRRISPIKPDGLERHDERFLKRMGKAGRMAAMREKLSGVEDRARVRQARRERDALRKRPPATGVREHVVA